MTIPSPRTFIEIALCIVMTLIVMVSLAVIPICLALFAVIEALVDRMLGKRRRV